MALLGRAPRPCSPGRSQSELRDLARSCGRGESAASAPGFGRSPGHRACIPGDGLLHPSRTAPGIREGAFHRITEASSLEEVFKII
ncbi:unnamed protein product [Coccothraustes coccothraustes]